MTQDSKKYKKGILWKISLAISVLQLPTPLPGSHQWFFSMCLFWDFLDVCKWICLSIKLYLLLQRTAIQIAPIIIKNNNWWKTWVVLTLIICLFLSELKRVYDLFFKFIFQLLTKMAMFSYWKKNSHAIPWIMFKWQFLF